MDFLVKLLSFLETEMTRPTSYGWFHLVAVVIIALTTVLVCRRFRDADDKTFRRVLFVMWLAMVLFETFKQLMFTFEVDGSTIVAEYQWYAAPCQLCGTPLFVLPFVIWGRESAFRDGIMSFISFFSFFGGVASYVYPEDLFVSEICINVQALFHHGMQIVLGIFVTMYMRRKLNRTYLVRGIVTFAWLAGIALAMDIVVYHAFVALDIDATFNMFFISPYFDCTLPVLNSIYDVVPYPVFLLIYLVGFAIIGVVMYLIQYGLIHLVQRKAKKPVAVTN